MVNCELWKKINPVDKLSRAERNHLLSMGIPLTEDGLNNLFEYVSDQHPDLRCEECIEMFSRLGYLIYQEVN